MKKSRVSGSAGRPPLTTMAAILLALRAESSDVEGLREGLARAGLKYSLSGVYAALLQARNAGLVAKTSDGGGWELTSGGVEEALRAVSVVLEVCYWAEVGASLPPGHLPEGWEVKTGLNERVFLVVPEDAARGVRERARRHSVQIGDVRERAPGSGTKMFEVARDAVPLLVPDQRGRARQLAVDEVEGHEPRRMRCER